MDHRYSLIIAGGSGTRLWPMSRAKLPKQLIPFIGGQSLLAIATDRLRGLVGAEQQYICAGESHRGAIVAALPGMTDDRYIGEPTGRDTLNAVGLGTAVIAQRDPNATVAIFTADHMIEPVNEFQQIVARGFALAESQPETLVTFGIRPTHAATGYGYLDLGTSIGNSGAMVVKQFKEKPLAAVAQEYFDAGPQRYLWNSGMFVWKAATLLDCIKRYTPENYDGLMRCADAWNTDARAAVLAEAYPALKKISVDYAVMEPASRNPKVRVAAVPMPLRWLDVGSWASFAQTLDADDAGNTAATGGRHALIETKNTLIASSDPGHLITCIGCEDMIIIHTPDATLVCHADKSEDIKKLHGLIGEKFGDELL